jgi:transposase
VISLEQWLTIRHLAAMGHSARQIARITEVDRKTVLSALARDAPPEYVRDPRVQEQLEQHRSLVEDGVHRGLIGTRLLGQVRAAGYAGSQASFYRWLAQVREQLREPADICRFETGPALQCQFDWSPYLLDFGQGLLSVFVYSLVLGYSRRVHFYPSLSEKLDGIIDGLEACLRHFGGSCHAVLIDNARAMVLEHRQSHLRFNDTFMAACGHYKINPVAAAPRHPQTKGKVENPFRWLEEHFLRGNTWRDWEHLCSDMAVWESGWEQRIHQTTKVAPAVRFLEERDALQPLPKGPFLAARCFVRHLNNDSTFSWGAVRYCVPGIRGRQIVRVRSEQGRHLRIYNLEGELVFRHTIRPPGSPPVLLPECYEGMRRRQRSCLAGLLDRFRQRYGQDSQTAEEFLKRLQTLHPNRPDRTLQSVLELLDGVPQPLAIDVLAEALELGLCEPQALQALLQRRLRSSKPTDAPVPPAQPYVPTLEVERSLQSYGRALPPPDAAPQLDAAGEHGSIGSAADISMQTNRPERIRPE